MFKNAGKYFKQYGERETTSLENFPPQRYDEVVCIPVYNEEIAFIAQLQKTAERCSKKVLAIIVINQPENTAVTQENQLLFDDLYTLNTLWEHKNLSLQQHHENLEILVIDRFTENQQIPKKQGVGLARKIACDCAAFLQNKNTIQSQKIFSSDADVIFPDNYFTALLSSKNSAAVFNFKHIASGNNAIDNATAIYEQSLHDYVHGLNTAGSIYAFHTIGSCLLIDSESYIAARGFPKRSGGEDFYLLNKLNKLKPVYSDNTITLAIQSRISERVPFGTGPAVKKLLAENSLLFFQQDTYFVLRDWINLLDKLSRKDNITEVIALIKHQDGALSSICNEFSLQENCEKFWKNFNRSDMRKKQLSFWFDGFKTLKLIHFLTAAQFPKQNHEQWLSHKINSE